MNSLILSTISLLLLLVNIAICQRVADPAKHAAIPFLENAPVIDGDLSDWQEFAHHDGAWDIYRLRESQWYDTRRNRLTDHGNEPGPRDDLNARYYIAWDSLYLYLGADVKDNVNDVSESRHAPKRWYYKDAIAWFIEAPADTIDEKFGQGDNAFCFVADTSRPDYGAWWRHGDAETSFIEEPLPADAVEYAIYMDSKQINTANYTVEAKINMRQTFAKSDPDWIPPQEGQVYRLMIVHCDPDGGEYGGHFLIYGKGDADNTWTEMVLGPPQTPIVRKQK